MSRALLLCLIGATGCSPGGGGHVVVPGDGDADGGDAGGDPGVVALPAPYTSLTFTISDVEVGNSTMRAGLQGKLVRGADGTLYYAYYKQVSSAPPTCNIAVFSTGDARAGINYDLKVAVLAPGASSWVVEKVPLADVNAAVPYVTSLYGLDGLVDAQDRLVLVFAGGGAATSSCGSSDLVIETRSASGTYTWQSPVTDSTACCIAADCNNDPACALGDTVGPWASGALDGGGALAVAYQDYHYAWDQDGITKQGLEMWYGGAATGIRPWSGKGAYSQLRWVPAKSGATFSGLMASYTSFSATGLFVARRTGATGHPVDWDERDLRAGEQVGERPSLAVAPDGTVGLAFHLIKSSTGVLKNDLVYCHSVDNGDHWIVPCETVDATNDVGSYPSLAFDKQSRPAISYYYCGSGGQCDVATDRLRYAWRDAASSSWYHADVHVDAAHMTGLYSSLVLDPDTDEPTIVFHDATRGAAMVARGHLTGGP
jgi:hypothetical protein